MALFNKLFGGGDPLVAVRKAFSREQWADVLAQGESLVDTIGDEGQRTELEEMVGQARNRLAQLNLVEAEAFLRAGDEGRAREHLDLAAGQATDPDLLTRVEQIAAGLVRESRPALPIAVPAAVDCGSGCDSGSCHGQVVDAPIAAEPDLDLDSRLELCLGGYPDALAERYQQFDEALKAAVVSAHSGEETAALAAFDQVPSEARHADFYYELGVLRARTGDELGAVAELLHCLELELTHPLAGDVLFNLHLQQGRLDAAGALLEELAAAGVPAAFWKARKSLLQATAGEYGRALELAEEAFRYGNREIEQLILFGQLLERGGRFDEAERILAQTGEGGGCGGGTIPLALAEFWLRQRHNPGPVLERFRSIWLNDPENPLWMLRTGEALLAAGCLEEGRSLLRGLLEREDIPAELRIEAGQVIDDNR